MSITRRIFRYLFETEFFWTYLPISAGLALSSMQFLRGPFDEEGFFCSLVGLLLFFAQLRFISDLRAYPAKLALEPRHPLSRSFISHLELRQLIPTWFFMMILFGLLLWQLTSFAAMSMYLSLTGYLFLIHKDFYFPQAWIKRFPFTYATLKHLALFFLVSFSISNTQPELLFEREPLRFAGVFVAAFLCRELGKTLDERSPAVLGAHIRRLGKAKFWLLYSALSLALAWAAWSIHLHEVSIPIQAVCWLLVTTSLLSKPSSARLRKYAEQASLIALILQAWSLPIHRALEEIR